MKLNYFYNWSKCCQIPELLGDATAEQDQHSPGCGENYRSRKNRFQRQATTVDLLDAHFADPAIADQRHYDLYLATAMWNGFWA